MNLALTLLAAAERHGEGEALVDGEYRADYASLQRRAAELAGGLTELGLKQGEPLCVLLGNRHQTVELYWATQWLGARFVPLNFRLSPDEVRYCVQDAEASLVAFEGASSKAAHACRDGAVTLLDVDGDNDGDVRLSDVAGDPHPGALDLDEGEISLMLYTSGTTGKPKGVPRSHRADRAGGLSQVIHHGYRWADRSLGVMPLYHTMGMHTMIAMALIDGGFVAMAQWDPEAAARLIAQERISSLSRAHPVSRSPRRAPRRRRSVVGRVDRIRRITDDAQLAARCAEAFDARVFFNHYGSTEYYTWAVSRDQAAKPGCAGRSAINTRLRIVRAGEDATPEDLVEPGEEGQVIADLRCDEAFSGYWKRPDADERAIRDGWYYPGDIARIDEDGELWIVGRVDDMIISGGENIHPVEVEAVLTEHPAVQEAAVIGVSDERWGQRVVAFVVAESVDKDELDRHCRESEEIAAFKRPREYRFVDELPKSPAGKLLRRELRKELDQ